VSPSQVSFAAPSPLPGPPAHPPATLAVFREVILQPTGPPPPQPPSDSHRLAARVGAEK
jgi:hypothetical protein